MRHALKTAAVAALFGATAMGSAFAGEEVFIATVCGDLDDFCYFNDSGVLTCTDFSPFCNEAAFGIRLGALRSFYLSHKEWQFTHANCDDAYNTEQTVRPCEDCPLPPPRWLGESFRSNGTITHFERCDVEDPLYNDPLYDVRRTNLNARVPANNVGFFEWTIVLPKKPERPFNIFLQCAVLKPQETDVLFCAADAGEIQGPGRCNAPIVNPPDDAVAEATLPKLTVQARNGPQSVALGGFTPFNLTAYKNPSNYTFTTNAAGASQNSTSLQILDGSNNARINLKACLTKSIIVKQPATGQVNALGQTEADLEAGDRIFIRLDIPRGHPTEILCHAQSAKVGGIGDPFTLLGDPWFPFGCDIDL